MGASSYIKTEGTEVTRVADSVRRSNPVNLYGSDGFSIYAEYDNTNMASIFSLAETTSSGLPFINFTIISDYRTQFVIRPSDESTMLFEPQPSGRNIIGVNKIIFSISKSEGVIRIASNGVLDTYNYDMSEWVIDTYIALTLGYRYVNTSEYGGEYLDFDIYPKALSEAEAIELTKL